MSIHLIQFLLRWRPFLGNVKDKCLFHRFLFFGIFHTGKV